MSNTSARIVLRNGAFEQANRILLKTQKGSLSELVSDLLFRYGDHFASTWKYSGCECSQANRLNEANPILQPLPITDLATNLDEPLSF